MKTIAYLDCPSGISGDMCLGAILDAGVPIDYLQTQLDRLGLGDEFHLSAAPVLRQGLRALKASVDLQDSFAQEVWQHDHGSHAHSAAHSHSHHSHEQAHPAHSHSSAHRSAHGHHSHTHSHTHSHAVAHSHGSSHSHASAHSHSHQDSHSHGSPNPEPSPSLQADLDHGHPPGTRHLPEIEALITQAGLPERVCRWSLAVFRQLAEAEAAVHGIAIDQVHFHEVGATDALVDIVGTCLGLDYLGIDELFCSALPTGQGRVKAAHGWLPVPAPAVLKLMEMRQMPIYNNGLWGERVTPTGAAIVAALAQGFGEPPTMTLNRVGLGAGQKDFPQANILRLWVGTVTDRRGEVSSTAPPSDIQKSNVQKNDVQQSNTPPNTETIAVLETQVDDMVPQAMGYLYDRLFEAGALDVFAQPIAMKKSRPGLLITVLCHPDTEARCTDILFAETPTLGIRHRQQQRTILKRDFQTLETPYGPITLKVAYHPSTQAVLNVHPEYEDCAALAQQCGVPWQVVYHTALGSWYRDQA
ncbi:nickel pincer cofactor biosynthesis protein LarC [Phormidium sp. FACHB-1136]|uniref:nickel pincer cofactor biosynthesis protein LarC n=1 Tax=Phormidium sp. FACHB-1136 TaxID=2692848 RepID=UPI0016863E53|nr:nickel pincer cofactor biosynthesis protein LarC [Phormidium sp. FACHB-1136]MBD2426114.1 nickel pincer cofactor biosynthesis protein LarC [Phormidium sp. FACHB-1136]